MFVVHFCCNLCIEHFLDPGGQLPGSPIKKENSIGKIPNASLVVDDAPPEQSASTLSTSMSSRMKGFLNRFSNAGVVRVKIRFSIVTDSFVENMPVCPSENTAQNSAIIFLFDGLNGQTLHDLVIRATELMAADESLRPNLCLLAWNKFKLRHDNKPTPCPTFDG